MIGQALFFRRLKRWALIGGSIFLVTGLVGNVAVVEYTTTPNFCGSCHNMVPYVESWKRSAHGGVGCIECHYEPGILETLEVKYKALSQLAKYATRTAGTKPWAEVADASCLRSGCHETRLLTGRIPFGEHASFDHRPHLLESRPGKRLHCTTCHGGVSQGEHISVSRSTCITCHFKPGESSWTRAPARRGAGEGGIDDCALCHRTPAEDVVVGEAPFSHAEYVGQRGVDCRECHDDVTRGDAAVSRDRCQQCHGEPEFMERFEQPEFLHQAHVSDSKVECFECHGEIQHGLFPRDGELAKSPHTGGQDSASCASCHGTSHSLQGAMFAGRLDGEDLPSRMYETRVACGACHREETAGHHPGGARLPVATEVGCFRCHGVEFAGMLDSWRSGTGATLADLDARVAAAAGVAPPADAQAARAVEANLAEARRRLDLVRNDRSGGAHNVELTRRLFEKARDDLGRALALLGQPAPEVRVGPAVSTELGCTTSCHTDLEAGRVTLASGRTFSHAEHLVAPDRREQVGDCDSCHDVERRPQQPGHGRLRSGARDCASCHHPGPGEELDSDRCATCHEGPGGWLSGKIDRIADPEPSAMEDLECGDCHSAPEEGKRWHEDGAMASCEGCHEDETELLAGFEEKRGALRRARAALEVQVRLAEVRAAQRTLSPEQLEALERARGHLRAASAGGLMHNQPLSERVLAEARAELAKVLPGPGGGE